MQFTTKVPIPKSNHPINFDSKIVSLGSCFAENMGEKFKYFKFQNTVNPFGIIFNPMSIEKLISRIVKKEDFIESDIFFHNERWQCYDVHSDLSHENKIEFLKLLNRTLHASNNQILEASHIIITYGTSWVYELKSSGEIVANCHKVPQNQFAKKLLSTTDIENAIANTIDLIRDVNPDCSFVFTVSPVRHLKDGFVENSESKAHLITALHSSIIQHPSSNYFPSYEIMMDELRDYRFYAEDMLHPSQSAINYIWEQFFLSHIDEAIFPIMEKVCSIQKSLLHKPFHPNSESHQKFLVAIKRKISEIQEQFPHIDFS